MELDDMENLNKEYKSDKAAYEKALLLKNKVDLLQKKLKTKQRQKEDAQIKKIRALEDKDKVAEKDADDKIKAADKDINTIKGQINLVNSVIERSKRKVDAYITEITQDPEIHAHMNSILEKRYNRSIKKIADKKKNINSIIEICEKHPSLENDLRGLIRAKEELSQIKEDKKELEKELLRLDPIADAARINQINNVEFPTLASKETSLENKNKLHKDKFMKLCQKESINVNEKMLMDLIENGNFARNKGTGEIQVLKSLNNMSKGCDKQIKVYEKAIEKIPGAKVYKETSEMISDIHKDSLPAQQFKWYQFGKRFKAWNERRKLKREQEEREFSDEGRTQESSKFKNIYKYDVVKDYIDETEQEIFKQSGRDVRREGRPTRSDEEER